MSNVNIKTKVSIELDKIIDDLIQNVVIRNSIDTEISTRIKNDLLGGQAIREYKTIKIGIGRQAGHSQYIQRKLVNGLSVSIKDITGTETVFLTKLTRENCLAVVNSFQMHDLYVKNGCVQLNKEQASRIRLSKDFTKGGVISKIFAFAVNEKIEFIFVDTSYKIDTNDFMDKFIGNQVYKQYPNLKAVVFVQ